MTSVGFNFCVDVHKEMTSPPSACVHMCLTPLRADSINEWLIKEGIPQGTGSPLLPDILEAWWKNVLEVQLEAMVELGMQKPWTGPSSGTEVSKADAQRPGDF